MSELHTAVAEYLALRRGLGFKLHEAGRCLRDFATYLEDHGWSRVSTQAALAWATESSGSVPRAAAVIATRLCHVRQFALDELVDPDTEARHRGSGDRHLKRRIAPHLFSRDEVAALVEAARSLKPPLRAATYGTFFGLLAVTGCEW